MSKPYVLPGSWALAPLEAVVEVLDHQRVPVNRTDRSQRAGDVPYYGATGQVGWIDDHLFNEELVLLGEDGVQFFDPLAQKAYVIRGRAWVNNHAHVLRPIPGVVDPRYLALALNAVDYRGAANGTTRLKLTKSAMVGLPVPLPPYGEQLRIADRHEQFAADVEVGRQSVSVAMTGLQRHREAILTSAVRGELTTSAGGDAEPVLREVLSRREERWRASGMGRYASAAEPLEFQAFELPSGWCWATIDQLAVGVQYGSSAKTSPANPKDVPVLRMGNIVNGALDLAELKYLPADHEEFPALLLADGDLLFNRTNSPELVGRPRSFGTCLVRVLSRPISSASALHQRSLPNSFPTTSTRPTVEHGFART